ncbi:hypothetical protein ON010_g3583 [Phytophthora cinnamomi]|nr:hypothetical protein ON010_g3583 [Phytophthora cinnamomi]
MQFCEFYANRPLKSVIIKKPFLRWKFLPIVPAGGKYNVNPAQMIHWIEEAISMVNEQQDSVGKMEYMFGHLGHDPRQTNNHLFKSIWVNYKTRRLTIRAF